MLQDIATTTLDISLSSAAAQVVRDIMAQKNLSGYALRVFVSGSGCCGAQFGMALDNNVHENDYTMEAHGLKLVVDRNSLEYLHGANIEYVNDPQHGAGFVVNSPNAKKGGSCGCGEGQNSGEGGCGGGSCGCGGH